MRRGFSVSRRHPSCVPKHLDNSIAGRAKPRYREPLVGFDYKAIGHLTGALDYALILTACIAAGVGYHSLVLGERGSVPDLMQYVGAGQYRCRAVRSRSRFARQSTTRSKSFLARFQVRTIVFFWSLALLSLALFLFLAKSGPDFSRGTIIIFGMLGLATVACFACLDVRSS